MSTNFYFIKESGEEIHIGQRACGWKPLFQATDHYSDFGELVDFYKYNIDNLRIENEFGVELEWYELLNEFVTWGQREDQEKDRDLGETSLQDEFGYWWEEGEFY